MPTTTARTPPPTTRRTHDACLILFAFTYCLMLALPRFRPFAALGGAGAFSLLGPLGGAFRFVSDY